MLKKILNEERERLLFIVSFDYLNYLKIVSIEQTNID